MGFYEDMRDNVSDSLLTDFGQSMILRAEGEKAVFDGATGFITTEGTDVDHQITGAIFDIKQTETTGTNILTGDKRALVSPKGMTVTPDTSMQLICDSEIYTIADVETVAPAGIPVLYKLIVRT